MPLLNHFWRRFFAKCCDDAADWCKKERWLPAPAGTTAKIWFLLLGSSPTGWLVKINSALTAQFIFFISRWSSYLFSLLRDNGICIINICFRISLFFLNFFSIAVSLHLASQRKRSLLMVGLIWSFCCVILAPLRTCKIIFGQWFRRFTCPHSSGFPGYNCGPCCDDLSPQNQ